MFRYIDSPNIDDTKNVAIMYPTGHAAKNIPYAILGKLNSANLNAITGVVYENEKDTINAPITGNIKLIDLDKFK